MLQKDSNSGGFLKDLNDKRVMKKADHFKVELEKKNQRNTDEALRGMKQTGYTGKATVKHVNGVKLI